jgi:hypothetical protein
MAATDATRDPGSSSKVKADLEHSLEALVLNCSKCGLDIRWVSGRDAGTLGAPGARAARLTGGPVRLTREAEGRRNGPSDGGLSISNVT